MAESNFTALVADKRVVKVMVIPTLDGFDLEVFVRGDAIRVTGTSLNHAAIAAFVIMNERWPLPKHPNATKKIRGVSRPSEANKEAHYNIVGRKSRE